MVLNLRAVALNPVPVFEATFEERGLSRAAVRLATTRSAVSHALSRLRLVFRDERFIRQSRGVVPMSAADAHFAKLRGTRVDREPGARPTNSCANTFSSLRRTWSRVARGRRARLAQAGVAQDLIFPWFCKHRVERVRLDPAVCRPADSVRNGAPRFGGSSAHVGIGPSLTDMDMTQNRMRFANVSGVLWQGHDR